jgi:hypothetical protein
VIVKQRLDELGYRERKNLIFDFRSAEGQLERVPQLAAEVARCRVGPTARAGVTIPAACWARL